MEMVVFILQYGEARDGDREDSHASNDAPHLNAIHVTSSKTTQTTPITHECLPAAPQNHLSSPRSTSHRHGLLMTRREDP